MYVIQQSFSLSASTSAVPEAFGPEKFGAGSGEIWLDNVECTGEENRLIDCPAEAIGDDNCRHSEDAGARCNGTLNRRMLQYSYHLLTVSTYTCSHCPVRGGPGETAGRILFQW